MIKKHVPISQLRKGFLWLALLLLLPILVIQLAGASPALQEDDPLPGMPFEVLGESGPPIAPVLIDQFVDEPENELNASASQLAIWYGLSQSFGHNGNPQRSINIVGTALTPGSTIKWLYYRVNSNNQGDFARLAYGSDKRRLYGSGDFNIELPIDELINGNNTVDIALTDDLGQVANIRINVLYTGAGNSWPKNQGANWSTSPNNSPQGVAQVVDGNWIIDNGKLKLAQGAVGYDRLIAIGEFDDWTDYEATIPLTIKGLDAAGFGSPSNGPGIGAVLRWNGYTKATTEMPGSVWSENLGAIAWNRYKLQGGVVSQGLEMIGYAPDNKTKIMGTNPAVQVQFNVPYTLKVSVRSVVGDGDIYRMKMWPTGQTEPDWQVVGKGDFGEPEKGSLALIAHHVDVEFGNITVKDISNAQYTLSLDKSGTGDFPVPSPPGPLYSYGQQVSVTANPTFPSAFGRWEGDMLSASNPVTVTMTSNTSLTAVYVPSDDYAAMGQQVSPAEGGTITVNPSTTTFLAGSVLTVTAKPNAGYKFVEWQKSAPANLQSTTAITSNPYTFVYPSGGTNLTAVFQELNQYSLTPGYTGDGSGTIQTVPDQSEFPEGSVVQVKAVADAGSMFTDWNPPYSGKSNPFFMLMDGPKTVSADFDEVSQRYTLNVSSGANGHVEVDPPSADNTYLFGQVVKLTAVPDPTYMLDQWSGTLGGNSNPASVLMTQDHNITASFVKASNPVSDDFNRCVLNNGNWTVTNPLNDAVFLMDGTKLKISLPAGKAHDLYNETNTVPRAMTPADDRDNLSLVAKMDSNLTAKTQVMGVLVQETPNKLLRFDIHYDGTKTNIYAASIVNGVSSQFLLKKNIGGAPPYYIKIQRNVDSWTISYSFDGTTYTDAKTFTFVMDVSSVGVFAGNPAATDLAAPAFTAVFDYFFNAARPIMPQDTNKNTISTATVGQGVLAHSPNKAEYACGETVRFTATADPDWHFAGWEGGSLTGRANPATLTVSGNHEVIAKFSSGEADIKAFMPMVRKP